MKVLIACEESQIVTEQFILKGHDAMSCDTDYPGAKGLPHYHGNVMDIINDGFDLMIAFPPCTHLAVSGSRVFKLKRADGRQGNGIDFFMKMINAPINQIAVENPIGIMSTEYRKPNQIIHPYYFGDPYPKSTCLWLKNLPPLFHSKEVDLFNDKITHIKPEYIEYNSKKSKSGKSKYSKFGKLGKGKGHERSKTPGGLAQAMAEQWG